MVDEAQGKPMEAVFHIVEQRSRKRVPNVVTHCLERGRVIGLGNHTVLIRRDGREYAIQDSAAPIRDQDGKVFGVVLVFSDVSETRRMAQQLSHQACHAMPVRSEHSGLRQ
jgi:PAS domain S-box-containing protein